MSEAEELERVLPVIRALAGEVDVPLSIDTQKPAVADAALAAGAAWINDVGGLRDAEMPRVAAKHGAGVIVLSDDGK